MSNSPIFLRLIQTHSSELRLFSFDFFPISSLLTCNSFCFFLLSKDLLFFPSSSCLSPLPLATTLPKIQINETMNKRRKQKKEKVQQPSRKITWSDFPNEVEDNILSRLPVKSLMRIRCVCKHWYNLFTKPHFIKLQLNLSTQIKQGSKLVLASGGKLYSVDVGECGKQYIKTRGQQKNHMQKELVLPFRDQYCEMFLKVSGSCNGLLCLSAFDSLYLLNPATKEYKRLSYPEILAKRPSSSSPILTVFGFGYSPRTDEYKVMMIIYYMIEQSAHSDVCVYTLGTNSSWRSIKGTRNRIKYPYHPALVNGALHWMTSGTTGLSIVPISFDFGDEKFRELSLPKSFNLEDTNHPMGLVELGGFLSLYHCKADENFDIWVMKDYGNEQSWTKEFSVAWPILFGLQGWFKPLCILKKNEVVLCESDHDFFILDVVKKEIRHLHLRHPPYAFDTEMYLESLVTLGTDGVDGRNKQERREKEGGRSVEETKSD